MANTENRYECNCRIIELRVSVKSPHAEAKEILLEVVEAIEANTDVFVMLGMIE